MSNKQTQSIEPRIVDLVTTELKRHKLNYKLEQESLNWQIDNALRDYASKTGGTGGNRVDIKLLLKNGEMRYYPVLIECKGYKDKLVKLGSDGIVANYNSKNEPIYNNINNYAVNGAIHYANALLHYTGYTKVIAIGVTGFIDDNNKPKLKIGIYLVSKANLGFGQEIREISKSDDFSFLAPDYFNEFIEKVETLELTDDELKKRNDLREQQISTSLIKLNNDIYKDEKGLSEHDRVYLVAATIMATLGIENKVEPLEKSELKSKTEDRYRDGYIVINKIKSFLSKKKIPTDKQKEIIRALSNTLLTENINKPVDGQSQLSRVFNKIVDDLGLYYKLGVTTDFTGKLFNEMYSWLGFTQDKLNDVVLTPSYVARLLVRLARVNKDSYVWDFATGSAGLLVAAMNEMLDDARNQNESPEKFRKRERSIKGKQLLGLEVLSHVYMLAVLNMILMGDGSSNILNKDSLMDFDGNYGFDKAEEKDKEEKNKKKERFPATAFVLNPPYSAKGNGMVFVKTALRQMEKGYAAVIIQSSAGSGKAKELNVEILETNTLIASIKMPIDIFIGKSSVQTHIYVFRVAEKHDKRSVVKFIDFTNDGYTRSNRKKAKNSTNLRDTDRAEGRYRELVDLVHFGKGSLSIFSEREYYESTIDPKNGADWNQSCPVDTRPTLNDFKKTVSDYLSWEVSNILKNAVQKDQLGK